MATPAPPVRFGILGTGAIAAEFADALADAGGCTVEAVGSRDGDRAARFAAAHRVRRWHAGHDALLADPGIDVVYVATPHPAHAPLAIAAARAGKGILCEKPLTVDAGEAEAVVASARRAGVFLMEAFQYRVHPQTARILQLVRAGAVGDVRAIEVSFMFRAGDLTRGRLVESILGGGAILDVGCYCTSAARLIAGAAAGTPVAEPAEVVGAGRLHPREGTDLAAAAVLRFESGVLAHVACAIDVEGPNEIRIHGTGGRIELAPPCWLDSEHDAGSSTILVTGLDGVTERIEVGSDRHVFVHLADHVRAHLREGCSPLVPWDDTLANMRVLDRWRAAVGVSYPAPTDTFSPFFTAPGTGKNM